MKKCVYVSFSLSRLLSLTLSVALVLCVLLGVNRAETPVSGTADNFSRVVIVDAGHGGEDGGTQSSAGVLEKNINLDISMKVGNILKLMGYTVVYTREDDSLHYGSDAVSQRQKKVSDIHYRMSLTEAYPGALLLSIHQNYFSESKYYGAQVFYSENNEMSKTLAESIQTEIRELIQPENKRQIKASGTDIYLLYNAKSPAVMVECGFLSNAGEALLLSDADYQKKLSLAICGGLAE